MNFEKRIKTAWLIDDDDIYTYGFKKLIQIKDFCDCLVGFEDGNEALNFLGDQANHDQFPEVIFVDLMMPLMSGWDFLDAFGKIYAQLGKSIALYIITSSVDLADIERAKKYDNLSDYLIKPTNVNELRKVFFPAA